MNLVGFRSVYCVFDVWSKLQGLNLVILQKMTALNKIDAYFMN